jgi:hypothetical protein
MATVSNFTASHTLFKRFYEISYAIAVEALKSRKLCNNGLADPVNLRNDDYIGFFYRNVVKSIEFLLPQPAFREQM